MTSDNAGRPLNFTQNIAQHGSGVAAGVYINRAPPPSVAVTSETGWESNGAGGFVKTLHVSVTSAGAIAGVRVLALGKIQELSAFPKVGGVFQTGHSGIRDDGQFLTVQSVGNWGGITITTTDPDTAELRMEIIG